MWCAHCGHEMTCQPGNHRYDESGLKNIVLTNISIWKCDACGETAVEIPETEELHKLLAIMVVLSPTGLQKEEIRFLRKRLGYSQEELAEKLGVSRLSVTRWEDGQAFQESHDKALRRLYVEKKSEEIHRSAAMKFLNSLIDGLPVRSKKIQRRIRLEDWVTSGKDHDCLEPESVEQFVEQQAPPHRQQPLVRLFLTTKEGTSFTALLVDETADISPNISSWASGTSKKSPRFIPIKGAVPPYGSGMPYRIKELEEEVEVENVKGVVDAN